MEFKWPEPKKHFPLEPVRPLRAKEPMMKLVYDRHWQLWQYRIEDGKVIYNYMQMMYVQGQAYL